MHRLRLLTLAATLLAALLAPGAASAASRCVGQDTTKAFEAYGDDADYSIAPGGDFEDGQDGWSFDRSRIVRGNETAGVRDGRFSLALGMGVTGVAEVVSPPFCVGEEHPTFRYLLRANGVVGALSTFLRYRDIDGDVEETQVRSKTATNLLPGRWKPSDLQPLATKIPLTQRGGTAVVQLVFRAPINVLGAGYQIDNVLIDPYRTK